MNSVNCLSEDMTANKTRDLDTALELLSDGVRNRLDDELDG
ncbi:hypothetical protein RYD26_03635 [Pasteurellaceae bacterium LIM206]|nr:hypothetical protein [Pasteurellaceae bacterium LIM206]